MSLWRANGPNFTYGGALVLPGLLVASTSTNIARWASYMPLGRGGGVFSVARALEWLAVLGENQGFPVTDRSLNSGIWVDVVKAYCPSWPERPIQTNQGTELPVSFRSHGRCFLWAAGLLAEGDLSDVGD